MAVDIGGQLGPVRRAKVTVVTATGGSQTTDSDTNGIYRFEGLSPGEVRVRVEKLGFVHFDRGPQRPLPIDLKIGRQAQVDVVMQFGAALQGRLVNDLGEPVANVVVSAVRLGFGPFGRQPVIVRHTRTDDLGNYRLHTLPPGEYYIEAAPDPLQGPSVRGPGEAPVILSRAYFPNSARVGDARVVSVRSGQEVTDLNFRLVSVPVALLRGSVTPSSGKLPMSFSIRLQRVGGPPGEVRGLSPPTGATFSFSSVPPGEYWLMATAVPVAEAPQEYSITRISIIGGESLDFPLVTAKGAHLSGRIEPDADTQILPGLQVVALATEYEFPPPTIPTPAVLSPSANGTVAADGTFTLASLLGPRLLRINRLPDGWAIKSIVLDDRDVTDMPVEFSRDDARRAARIQLTSRTGTIAGVTQESDGNRRGGARVVVFGADPRQWGLHSRFVKTAESAADGRYAIRGLLPGRYFIIALDAQDNGSWEDPEVLGRLSAAAQMISLTDDIAPALTLIVRDIR